MFLSQKQHETTSKREEAAARDGGVVDSTASRELTAIAEAAVVFPVPGVPVMRTFGRFLVVSVFSSSMVVQVSGSKGRNCASFVVGRRHINLAVVGWTWHVIL
jgi:hypothetical protein